MVSDLSCVQVPQGAKDDFTSEQQPCLLITDGVNFHIQNNMFTNKPPLHHHCYYDVGGEIPEFLGRNIGCSFREWVLLIGSYGDRLPHVLVNLLSKETIELPLRNFKYEFCIITSPPSDPTCHIVFFNRKKLSFIIWQPGDKKFTIRKWNQVFPSRVRALVAGKLCIDILTSPPVRCLVLMVEFKESTYRFEVVEMDRREMSYMRSMQDYLFEYSGELFCLYKIMCGYHSSKLDDFKIFKADLLNKKWVRIEKLGRLAIFIGYKTGHAHCVAAVDDSGIQANSIYFLEEDDLDSYYVYNLEEGTVRMKPVLSSMETTRDGRKHLDWIMMPYVLSFSKLLKDDQESIRQDSEKEMKENGEVEEVEVQESWNIVPPELLNLIRSRLFGKDYAMFSVVCKAWHQTSIRDYSTPSLLSLETLLLEQCQSSSPLLMSQEDRTSSVPIFRFFDPVHRKLYRTTIPQLREADIHHSRDGWLLVRRSCDGTMFFLNPLTQEKIELPRMSAHVSTDVLSFSFSSPPNCLVIGTSNSSWTMYTLKHGDRTWREHRVKNIGADGDYLWNHVVLNRLHYFVTKNRDMVVFNSENGVVDQFPDSQSRSFKFRGSKSPRGGDFLVEIDGGPAFVSVEPNGGDISIFKWNDLEKDWESMEGGVEFGGKVMFLSKRCTFLDDVGGMGNIIFLPLIEDTKFGVFHSLATRKYHTFYGDYSSELPYHVDKFLDGIWVQPDRKIVGHDNFEWLQLTSPPEALINGCGCWTWLIN